MLKYTLSAGHPQPGGVDLDLAVEDDVFHSIRLTRMDDEFGSNGKSSVAAICEISQACRLTMKARISVPDQARAGNVGIRSRQGSVQSRGNARLP